MIEKDVVNRLMAIDCPDCGLEMLSTCPFPAKVGKECEIICGGCGGVGKRVFPSEWQYTDINAYPVEQTSNRRVQHSPHRESAKHARTGVLEWD